MRNCRDFKRGWLFTIIPHKDSYRFRIGVGHPGNPDKVVSYVFGKPRRDDEDRIVKAISSVIEESELLFAGQIQELMNSFNTKQAR